MYWSRRPALFGRLGFCSEKGTVKFVATIVQFQRCFLRTYKTRSFCAIKSVISFLRLVNFPPGITYGMR